MSGAQSLAGMNKKHLRHEAKTTTAEGEGEAVCILDHDTEYVCVIGCTFELFKLRMFKLPQTPGLTNQVLASNWQLFQRYPHHIAIVFSLSSSS